MSALAPDYAEPLVGWRSWVVVEHAEGLRLRSVVFKTIWAPRLELLANCEHRWPVRLRLSRRRGQHDVPGVDCHCGVYAAPDPESAAAYFYLYADLLRHGTRHRVIGTVNLWGSVVEAERGWRASRAYPARIYVPTHGPGRRKVDAEEIAFGLTDYGVPVHILDDEGETPLGRALADAGRKRAA